MAERKKKKARTPVKRVAKVVKNESPVRQAAPLTAKLRRTEPAMVQLGQDTLRYFVAGWDKKRIKSLLGDVASRKRPLESALLDIVTDVRDAAEKSVDDTRDRSVAEQRLDKQYRDQLIAQGRKPKRTRMRKGEIRIQGQIIHPKSSEPVAGVVVEAIEKGVHKRDMLGAAVTDTEGRFDMVFRPNDYEESGGKMPEVLFNVGADRKNMFYVADQPLALKADKQEPVTIALPESCVEAIDAFLSRREQLAARRGVKASETVLRRDMENEAVNAAGDAVLSLLASGIRLLEARLEKSGSSGKSAGEKI